MIGFKIKTRYVLVTSSPISTYMRCCQLYLEEVEDSNPARLSPPVGFQDRSLQPDLGIPPY